MAVTQASDPNDPTGTTPIFYSSVTGQSYSTADDAHAAEASMSGNNLVTPSPTAAPAPVASGDDNALVWQAAQNGMTYNSKTGVYTPMTDQEKINYQQVSARQSAAGNNPNDPNGTGATPTNPNANTSAVDQANAVIANLTPKPAQSQTPAQSLAASGVTRAPAGTIDMSGVTGPGALANTGYRGNTGAVVQQTTAPGSTATGNGGIPAAAPKVDTTASDKTVLGVNNTISQLLALAQTSPQTSAAEAQLMKSDQLAKIRDAQSLADNQSAALGAARSGNRRDQGLLGRQAIGESEYLGQADQRNQVVQQAELEGNLASLRATEEQTDFTNRANILSKAADLGLNVAGLQIDVGKANLGAASSYLNDQFQQLGIDKQVSVQQTQNVLSFMQGMSTIQEQYDAMSNADQQHTLDLMMQQYGIDKAEESALAQIKASKKVTWDQFLSQAALGAISGGAAIGASAIKGTPPGA